MFSLYIVYRPLARGNLRKSLESDDGSRLGTLDDLIVGHGVVHQEAANERQDEREDVELVAGFLHDPIIPHWGAPASKNS